jgi:hypothetical protein
MGAEYKEDCVFCPDHARQVRETNESAEKGTTDCAGSSTKGG